MTCGECVVGLNHETWLKHLVERSKGLNASWHGNVGWYPCSEFRIPDSRCPFMFRKRGFLPVCHVATKKLRDFAPTEASIDWVLTLGKELTKSFKSFFVNSQMQNDLKDFVNSLPNVSTQSILALVGAKSRNFLVATWFATLVPNGDCTKKGD